MTDHILYADGDDNLPPHILDRNGSVVLSKCKKCGKAEIELSEPCERPTRYSIRFLQTAPMFQSAHSTTWQVCFAGKPIAMCFSYLMAVVIFTALSAQNPLMSEED